MMCRPIARPDPADVRSLRTLTSRLGLAVAWSVCWAVGTESLKFSRGDLEQALVDCRIPSLVGLSLSQNLFALFIYQGEKLISHSVWQRKCVHKKAALCQELKHSWSWLPATLKVGFTPPTVKVTALLKLVLSKNGFILLKHSQGIARQELWSYADRSLLFYLLRHLYLG